jgi:hypothetical protein
MGAAPLQLKRPTHESLASKRSAVDDLLQRLALTKCRATRIGGRAGGRAGSNAGGRAGSNAGGRAASNAGGRHAGRVV